MKKGKVVDLLAAIRDSIKTLASEYQRIYTKATDPDMLLAYWKGFLTYCINQGHISIAKIEEKADAVALIASASLEELQHKIPIKWIDRNPETFRLKSGIQIKWFRFLFPEIPEAKADYDKHPLNRVLRQTIHPNAEKLFGIEYKVKDAPKGKSKAGIQKDAKGNPTIASDVKPLMNTVLRTLAYFAVSLAKFNPEIGEKEVSSIISGYALQEKLDGKLKETLIVKIKEAVQAEINIRKARSERKVA